MKNRQVILDGFDVLIQSVDDLEKKAESMRADLDKVKEQLAAMSDDEAKAKATQAAVESAKVAKAAKDETLERMQRALEILKGKE